MPLVLLTRRPGSTQGGGELKDNIRAERQADLLSIDAELNQELGEWKIETRFMANGEKIGSVHVESHANILLELKLF